MRNDDLCPMSDLPPDQCALPCHRDESLPAGADPEVRRGVDPSGTRIWPPLEPVRQERDTRVRPKRPKPLQGCRWDAGLEEWVTREHVRDCDYRACRGCKPCGGRHCAMRGRCPNHVDPPLRTCPQCIGVFRTTVGEVETLTTLVWEELPHSAVGSEVVNLAGPVAAPEQVDARRRWEEDRGHWTRTGGIRGWCDYPRRVDDDDELHPTAVFNRWEGKLRDVYGPPATLFPTLTSSAAYIRGLLDNTSFPHDDVFEDVSGDILRVRTHLENVLSDSRQPDQGAPCPTCAVNIQLAREDRKAPRLELRHGHWCDNPDCKRQHDEKGVTDEWVCPVDGSHRWKEADYRLRVAGEYLERAGALTASQMHAQWGIRPSTLRTWAERGQVKRRGKDANGRLLYDVAQARACEETRREDDTAGRNVH